MSPIDYVYSVFVLKEACADEESFFDRFFSPATINGAQHIAAILCSSGTTGLPKGNLCNTDLMCNSMHWLD